MCTSYDTVDVLKAKKSKRINGHQCLVGATPYNTRPYLRGWTVKASNVLTEWQHQYTQSGHTSLCKQCAIDYTFWPWLSGQSLTEVSRVYSFHGLLGSHWPKGSTGQRLVRKKRPEKHFFFFFWFPLRIGNASSRSGLTKLCPHRKIDRPSKHSILCLIHMALQRWACCQGNDHHYFVDVAIWYMKQYSPELCCCWNAQTHQCVQHMIPWMNTKKPDMAKRENC